MDPHEDAYGQAMLDYFHGRDAWEIVERDDGFFSIGAGPELYFSEFEDWRPVEQQAMDFVRGRILDVGCGAGRVMLYLRDKGYEIMGIDSSPAAIETCRLRGLSDVHVMSMENLSPDLGRFDSVLLLGGNLGLLGDPQRAGDVLHRLHDQTTPQGRIIGASRDRTTSSDPDVKDYVRRNLQAGRFSGQSRIRIRYRTYVTPFFDFIRLTPDELDRLLGGTGWVVNQILRQDDLYVAVIDKES